MTRARIQEWTRSALCCASGDDFDRLVLRALLLGFAFWIPISIVGAQLFGYSAAVAWAALVLRRRSSAGARRSWVVPLVLFVVFSIIGALAGPDPARALRKLNRFALLAVIFAPAASLPTDDARRSDWGVRLLVAFVAGASLRAAYDVLRIGGAILRGARGIDLYDLGNMRDPQFYLSALLILLALGVARKTTCGNRLDWRRVTSFLLNAAALVLHFKRGVWLAFGIAATALCAVCRRRILLPAAVVAAALLALPPVRSRLAAVREEWHPRASRRILWTQIAPALLRKYPWGVGRGVLRNEDLCRYGRLREKNLTHLHNSALQVGVEAGWAGLASWLIWMGTVTGTMIGNIRRAWTRPETDQPLALGVGISFLALHLNGLVENNFGDSEIFMWFVLLMGLALLGASASRSLNRGAPAGAEGL